MASIDHIPPPMTAYAEPTTSNVTAPPMASRQDSLMTVDMHIPGAWNGTNPGTPAPISEDFKYFGETLRTVPGTVQNHLPAREQVASGGSTILNKAAAIVPASVMNTATNVLPKSTQPTMSPTAADAKPPTHPTDLSNEHPITTTTNIVDHKELESSKTDAPSSGNTLMDKAAGVLPASVIAAAAAYLPASITGNTTSVVQESHPNATAAPTSSTEEALKNTVSPEETKAVDEAPASTTWTEKAKSILPVGAVGAAAAYLPASMTGNTTSAVQESHPNATTAPTGNTEEALKKTVSPEETKAVDEPPASTAWTEKAKTILPVGAVGAAAAYLPSTLSPKTTTEDAQKQAPTGEEEDLNAPLPPLPSTASPAIEMPKKDGLLMGSSVSPDADVQEALSKAANPHEYKSEIIPPMNTYPSTAPSLPPKEDQKSIESTQAVGGTTPMTPNSYEAEGDGYPAKNKSGVSGLAALAAVGGVGAIALDHSLKDQRQPAVKQHDGPSRLDDGIARPNEPAKDSFIHVVIPATPGAGLHEQEPFDKKAEKHARHGSLSSPEKLKKRDRSGSISAGEASPSSPSKSGMFSGIRKLSKKKDKGVSKGHEGNASHGDAAPPAPAHGDSLETRDSNSSGPSPISAGEEKKDRNVLHKDPPAHHSAAGAGEVVSPTTTNEGSGSVSKRNKDGTSGILANPFSPNSPASSSPSKVGFREKVKGEFMVVQGKLTGDESLKEAGEKRKKGTL